MGIAGFFIIVGAVAAIWLVNRLTDLIENEWIVLVIGIAIGGIILALTTTAKNSGEWQNSPLKPHYSHSQEVDY
ncbi:hypothetical protein AB0I69_26460 [Streptomyces sp. NPDC050508]|uniref:hypothetical protein n=1 Tax=Streptomyces sp. NPDC050508 TaxID=3155405 RepID=UPI0034431C78